jgi:hypothetical protein
MYAKGLKPSDIRGYLYLLNRRGSPSSADEVAKLIHRKVHKLGNVSAVIIDPIYKTLNGLDENKAGDISLLMNVFDRMSSNDDVSVIFAAHFSKGSEEREAIDRVSGSGVFARDPDSFVTFTGKTVKEKYGRRGKMVTKHVKNRFIIETHLRNHPESDPLEVEWNFPIFTVAPPEELIDFKEMSKVDKVEKVTNPDLSIPKRSNIPDKQTKQKQDKEDETSEDLDSPIGHIPSKVIGGVILSGLDQVTISFVPRDGIKREDLIAKCLGSGISKDSTIKRIQKLLNRSLLVKKMEDGIEHV